MSGEREPFRPPILVRFAVGVLAKSYEDLRSWSEQVREDVARIPEEMKKIPVNLIGLPVQAVADAVSSVIRIQQNFNDLVIRGDETIDAFFYQPEEQPAWATFDEDEEGEALAQDEVAAAAPTQPKDQGRARNTTRKHGSATAKPAGAASPKPASTRSSPKPASTKPATAKPAAPKPPVSKPRTEKPQKQRPTTQKPPAAKPAAPKPPVSKPEEPSSTDKKPDDRPELVGYLNYDSLSLAQLRAKARDLSLPELRELLAYERSGTSRAPFLTLLENRISASGA